MIEPRKNINPFLLKYDSVNNLYYLTTHNTKAELWPDEDIDNDELSKLHHCYQEEFEDTPDSIETFNAIYDMLSAIQKVNHILYVKNLGI